MAKRRYLRSAVQALHHLSKGEVVKLLELGLMPKLAIKLESLDAKSQKLVKETSIRYKDLPEMWGP